LHIVAVLGTAEAMNQDHEGRVLSEAFVDRFAEEGGKLIAAAVCEYKSESGGSPRVERTNRGTPKRITQGLEIAAQPRGTRAKSGGRRDVRGSGGRPM